MFRSKKAGSFLSILMVFSVVAGSFPIQAFAEMYTGELVLPNTNVVSDYRQAGGYGQVSATGFNDSYFPGAPTLSERADSNFITSLPQKIFSASIRNGILNCTGDDINLNANNGSIILTYIMPSDDGNNNSDPLCMPAGAVSLTDQNTVLANNGSRNSYGGLGVTQTYNALPVVTLGESAQTTSVESIPNDPNNVRVTVSENVIQEAYGMHFERRGDVERVLNGDYRAYFPDNGFYQEGKTYVINWVSNWIGQTSRTNCDNEGNCYTAWDGQVPGYCYDDICGSDPLKVNTGYPTPQIVQIASTAPTLVSSSVVRPRNSDILSVTQPQCRRWSDGNFWRTVQHVYCITYGLSADGRYGHADYYDSVSSSGWFQEFLGVALAFAGMASLGGADFGITSFFGQLGNIQAISLSAQNISNWFDLYYAFTAASTAQTLAAITATTAGVVAAMIGPTALGTVESSNGLGVGTWTWSQAPRFQETTGGGDNDLCLNIEGVQTAVPDGYTRDAANETCIRGVCPNGASDYPICTIILNYCPDGTLKPESGICPDTDLCTNIEGTQLVVPAGYTRDADGNCNLDNTTDLCKNIDGVQRVVPAGYERDASGNCNRGGTDLCPNIAGIQLTVPDGYTRNSVGLCISNNTPNIDGWQVVPTLVRSGESTFVSWGATGVSDCTVSSTNGDSLRGSSGTRVPSLPILGQTTFSISCTTDSGASIATSSKTVNIIPTFQER